MIKKELLGYSLLVLQPIFMASNLVVARGGVEFIPPISLAFWRWLTVFLILLIFNYTIFSKKKIILKEYKKLFFLVGLATTLTRSMMIGFLDVLPVYILMGIAIVMMIYESFFDKS